MGKLVEVAAPRDGFLAVQILFFLRFIQLGSTVLTGFIACFLVWWHDRLHEKVPSGLIILICAVSFFSLYVCIHFGSVSPDLLVNATSMPSSMRRPSAVFPLMFPYPIIPRNRS